MFDKKNGIWQADPPLYDCIMIGKKYDDDDDNSIDEYNGKKSLSKNDCSPTSTANQNGNNSASNLEMYINMDVVDNITTIASSSTKKYGIVLNVDSIRRLFEI